MSNVSTSDMKVALIALGKHFNRGAEIAGTPTVSENGAMATFDRDLSEDMVSRELNGFVYTVIGRQVSVTPAHREWERIIPYHDPEPELELGYGSYQPYEQDPYYMVPFDESLVEPAPRGKFSRFVSAISRVIDAGQCTPSRFTPTGGGCGDHGFAPVHVYQDAMHDPSSRRWGDYE